MGIILMNPAHVINILDDTKTASTCICYCMESYNKEYAIFDSENIDIKLSEMFGPDAPMTGSKPANAGTEWLDIAAKKQPGPSRNMYSEPMGEYWGYESNNQQGKQYQSQQRRNDEKEAPKYGAGPDEFMQGFPLQPAGPYANITSFPTNAMVNQGVKFDASKSHDCDNQPVKNYVWDFGDGTPNVTTNKHVTNHAYKKPQVYPVTVTVTDKYDKKSQAGLNQRVNDPKNPLPPYAQLDSDPPTQMD